MHDETSHQNLWKGENTVHVRTSTPKAGCRIQIRDIVMCGLCESCSFRPHQSQAGKAAQKCASDSSFRPLPSEKDFYRLVSFLFLHMCAAFEPICTWLSCPMDTWNEKAYYAFMYIRISIYVWSASKQQLFCVVHNLTRRSRRGKRTEQQQSERRSRRGEWAARDERKQNNEFVPLFFPPFIPKLASPASSFSEARLEASF